MPREFFVGQDKDDYPVRVVLSRSGNYVFLFHDDRLVLSLSANDVFLIKDEVETERAYKGMVMVYLTRLIKKMEPCFESALNNEAYVEDMTEAYARQLRHIPPLEQTEKIRQQCFRNALRQVDYRLYIPKDGKVGA